MTFVLITAHFAFFHVKAASDVWPSLQCVAIIASNFNARQDTDVGLFVLTTNHLVVAALLLP